MSVRELASGRWSEGWNLGGVAQDGLGKAGRLTFPIAMLAYPFYLWKRSPGKEGSHYDPKCDLFTPAEEPLVSCNSLVLI